MKVKLQNEKRWFLSWFCYWFLFNKKYKHIKYFLYKPIFAVLFNFSNLPNLQDDESKMEDAELKILIQLLNFRKSKIWFRIYIHSPKNLQGINCENFGCIYLKVTIYSFSLTDILWRYKYLYFRKIQKSNMQI